MSKWVIITILSITNFITFMMYVFLKYEYNYLKERTKNWIDSLEKRKWKKIERERERESKNGN